MNWMAASIIPPLATPLKDQDELDYDGMERLIAHVLAGGVSGIFVLGTTGEGPSLSYRLRCDVIRTACQIAPKRVPVLAGITDTSYTDSLKLAAVAAEAGASAVAVAPPFYLTYSQAELLRYVERLAADSPLPIYLYNIPQLTKVAYGLDVVRAAIQMPRVIGLKDSSHDLPYLGAVLEVARQRPEFQVYVGPEEILLEGLMLGATGGVCGGANLHPGLFVRLFELARSGKLEEARRLQDLVNENSAALYTVGDRASSYLRGMKAALNCLGICSDLPALPLSRFSDEERSLLAGRMTKVLSGNVPRNLLNRR